jgi:hypothetical protein
MYVYPVSITLTVQIMCMSHTTLKEIHVLEITLILIVSISIQQRVTLNFNKDR